MNDQSPHFDNADFDEIVFHFPDPDGHGDVDKTSALNWYPKGTTHRRVSEAVAGSEICWSWLLMSADTLRLTKVADMVAERMETGSSELGAPT